jgi:transcriptional regulator with XRE-family HTH domain
VTSVAEYLRTRREQLQPADVGLPDSGRRRTPGLRREEVATLAGISIDYLVRFEQGRDTRPSASVIGALADALLVGSDQGAVSAFQPVRLPGPSDEPDVRLSPHRALHVFMPTSYRSCSASSRPSRL